MPIISCLVAEFDLSVTRCSGAVTLEEIRAHVRTFQNAPGQARTTVILDVRDANAQSIGFKEILSFVWQFNRPTDDTPKTKKAWPHLHVLTPNTAIYGVIRQLGSVVQSVGGLHLDMYQDEASLLSALDLDGVSLAQLHARGAALNGCFETAAD